MAGIVARVKGRRSNPDATKDHDDTVEEYLSDMLDVLLSIEKLLVEIRDK